jgi:hypothetical protein
MAEFIATNWFLLFVMALLLYLIYKMFNRETYKGTWVSISHEKMPVALEKIRLANGFMDHDGMTIPLEIMVIPESDKLGKNTMTYQIKVPEHVFHNVEHQLILKELGIK